MTTITDERPTFDGFCPFSPQQNADPYPALARARDEQPVFYSEEFGFWVVTRYADVNRIFGEPIAYSSASVLAPRMARPPQIDAEFGDRQLNLHNQLVMTDPPAHTRLKKLMSPAFMPRRVLARAEWIKDFCNRLIDGFIDQGHANLINDYAALIPTAVVGKVVGAPEEDARHFARWVDDIFTLTGAWDVSEDDRAAAWRGVFAFEDYIRGLVEDRRQNPQDDLTTDFIQATSDDGSPAMSDTEVIWNVFNVAAAGADTTGVLIGQMIHLLLSNPDQWAALKADPTLALNAIDETLRLRSPVRGLMRKTTCEVTIGGIKVPADSLVFTHIASANHDQSVFEAPERFDIKRANANKNLGFGSRAHACIGAPLARLEARIAIETLIERLPNMRFAEGGETLAYKTNLVLPAISGLNVRW
jgi:cytochrome P450